MKNPNDMYRQFPEEFRDNNGLLKAVTDTNGNEFYADKRNIGSELIIDYPFNGSSRVVDYRVEIDNKGIKYWKEVGRRRWIPDQKLSFCGTWEKWV